MSKDFIKLHPRVSGGLEAFIRGDFYEAHECFEDAWRETSDESREFYRALLHLSGGFYRLTQNHPEAARKFFSHAHRWLTLFPTPYNNVDISRLQEYVLRLIDVINKDPDSVKIRTYQANLIELLTQLE